MTDPLEFVLSSDEVIPVIAKPVVVAAVPVAFWYVKLERVDEAGARNPLRKARVVEVEFSPVDKVVHGNLNPGEDDRVPLVRERFAPMVKAPMLPPGKAYGIWEESDEMARLVVVA